MSIRGRRNSLKIYRKSGGGVGQLESYEFLKTINARIDKGITKTSFLDGKLTTDTSPVLFCDFGIEFRSDDLIEDLDGQRYVLAEGKQPDGVSGIKPITFRARKEIRLEKSNG